MNYDSIADAEGRLARTTTDLDRQRGVSSGPRGPAALAARLATVLVAVLGVAWLVTYGLPAFGGLLALTVVGFVAAWTTPWLVVTGVTRALEATE